MIDIDTYRQRLLHLVLPYPLVIYGHVVVRQGDDEQQATNVLVARDPIAAVVAAPPLKDKLDVHSRKCLTSV